MAEFLHGQLAMILLMSICYITGLWLVGLEFALPIGLLAGILVFVPYLGMIVGLTFATLAAVIQFQKWSGVIAVWAVFAFGQLFGFFGILLALPVSVILLVWLRHIRQQYLESNLYNS